ncbi:cobaltochelatase subunit CobN [Tenacibaculum soleae]|uniref:Cobaltochelatase subunit CobN n=1 Tax=Tenacibaculum soleae TaxID=447689 RepID=A0A1B9XWH7_9FLAO|nr:cobaltochelatase subunit CobN [Tenacibaculum soleae]MDO6813971.1 cobaltochelatase subunit CobN [Tenacibaculum soleae]OCK41856.1 cobaltochelatase subunit CobN [Tenacibaculum soleae]
MHLISTIPGGWNPNDEGVFYIDQSPGDIVFLSSADSDLFMMNNAYKLVHNSVENAPSFRFANLSYFKQELTIDTYIDEVISSAKIVVLKLLGGKAYYNYLCEAVTDCCEENNIQLVFLPGDNKPDLELMQSSNIPLKDVDLIWKYIQSGGIENCKSALQLINNRISDSKVTPNAIKTIPDLFLYHPKEGIYTTLKPKSTQKKAIIFGYRSYYLSNNLAPIHSLISALETQGISAVVLMAAGYREYDIQQQIFDLLKQHHLKYPQVIINTTGFSVQGFHDTTQSLFDVFNVPVIQAIMGSCNHESWLEGNFGLPPTDIAMNIALPEVDGKIISKVISFKESIEKDTLTDSEVVSYAPHIEGCQFVAKMAKAWINLQNKNNSEKKIALVLPNYPNKNSRLANGVGLDTPQSTLQILAQLADENYELSANYPTTTNELINKLTDAITNDVATINTLNERKTIRLEESIFYKYYNQLSPTLRNTVEAQWGQPNESPNYKEGAFLIPGFISKNIFVSIQPSRGYNLDLQASYHSPDLPPPPAYLAYYIWLQYSFKADALVHIGKHGNLEWLPGKSVALSKETCFPAAILGAIPHFYPFIINDPGEGTQAKRRNQAIILDHLIPPMTRAENYGDLLKLELLIDEFYESALVDRKRATLIKTKIESLVNETHLKTDLNQDGKDIDALLEVIDGYLCELKESQIRGGLHILGKLPRQEKLVDLIVALHRLPQGNLKGITQCLADDLQLNFDPINVVYSDSLDKEIFGIHCRTYGQAVELLENKAKNIISQLLAGNNVSKIGADTIQIIKYIQQHTMPVLQKTSNEIGNLIKGLNGQYVPAGGSGAPTRGRLDILPTGRNFYSVDIRTVPSETAYQLGQKSAQNIIDRYLQENGEYPSSIGLSVWGTSTMRTSGDDIAQALALIGVKPVWQGSNRRVKDFKILSTLELKRPRVDVMLRISGFFRDAFPDLISLFNAAIEKVASLDETAEQNPIKKRFDEERKQWKEEGLDDKQASERALYRVFGSKPGAYGAGLQGLIDGKNWTTSDDLAQAYINWSGYAYAGKSNSGKSAHETFKKRLANIEVVMQNQDNREHDILDSDDYYQFQGGMTAAVNTIKGSQPEIYFGDHSRPENPKVKSLKEELLKVFRSRVVNPKWMQGMREHGYKGAFEMAATMDYLFAYDATTNLIEDFMYEQITDNYLFDNENKEFIEEHNPWALKDMSERMLEAVQRGMWENPSKETIEQLKDIYKKSDAITE